MADTKPIDIEGDTDLKGKDFDEVCELLKGDDSVKGQVHKRPDGIASGAGRWAYCFGFLPNEYNEAELLDLIVVEYGPGIYPVQFKGKGKGSRPKIRWQKDMTVQARRLSSAPTAQPSTSGSSPTTLSGLDTLAQALENQARILETMAAAIATPPPAVKTTLDFLSELGSIKELFSDNRQSALEQFRDAMELRKLIKDDDTNGDDPLSAAIKVLTPAIERGVAALQESEVGPTRPQVTPAPSTLATDVELEAAGARVAASTAADDTDAAIAYAYQWFAEKYLAATLQLAESKENPEHVAAYLIRLIGPDEKAIDLVGLVIAQDDMVLRFSKVNSRVLQFTGWLDLVADWVAHALWPATNPAPGPASATQSATIDEIGGDGDINAPDAPGDQPDDATATEGLPLDAKSSSDAPRTGDDNNP